MVAARVLAWDGRASLVALNALTPLLFLPAWPVAVVAGITRQWALLGVALVTVAAHVALAAPELAAREPVPTVPAGALHFRLFSGNVYARNPDPSGIAAEIVAARPDVVFLQEATPAIVGVLDRAGALAPLPSRIAVPRGDPAASLLASRWPLVDQEVVEVDGRPILLRATAETERGRVRLYAVHVVAPFGANRPAWIAGLGRVADAIAAETEPVLVAGDFNATWNHRAFRDVLAAGVTDAGAARGRPLQFTWPRNRRFLPPVTRIDHVLTSAGLTVTAIRTGQGRGSDHRPLVADVACLSEACRRG